MLVHNTAWPRSSFDLSRRFSLLLLFTCIALASMAGVSDAQSTYYVSPTGSDSSSGSASAPFLTIQHAADLVNPGDTVIVEDGVYTGVGTGTACAAQSTKPIVCITRGGTSTAPVTFRSQNLHGAKLDGQNNTSTDGIRIISGANYVVVDGFEIYGMGNGNGSSSGVELYSGGAGSVIRRNHIHDIGHMCTGTTNGEVGIFIEQPNIVVTQNILHDIGRYMVGENGCTVGYSGSTDHGIYNNGSSSSGIPGANGTLIANNIFYNLTRGWGVQAYPGNLTGVTIVNNTFAFPNPYQYGHIIIGANTTNMVIQNNIFYAPNNAAIDYYSGTQTNLQVTNNLVYNASLFTSTPSGATISSIIYADPLMVSTASPYDFHLTSGSPAINAGVTLSSVPTDFDGNARTSPWDIGAYEYGSSSTVSTVATPSITPGGGSFSGSVSVTLADSTSGATIYYTTDGTTPTTSSPIYAGAFTLTTSATVQAMAAETGMTNSAVAVATFTATSTASPSPADTTAPTVAITSPADGATVSGHWINITASATDNVAVASVKFYVDGALLGTDTTSPYAVSWNVHKASAGAHTLTAVATDTSANTATTSITVYK